MDGMHFSGVNGCGTHYDTPGAWHFGFAVALHTVARKNSWGIACSAGETQLEQSDLDAHSTLDRLVPSCLMSVLGAAFRATLYLVLPTVCVAVVSVQF